MTESQLLQGNALRKLIKEAQENLAQFDDGINFTGGLRIVFFNKSGNHSVVRDMTPDEVKIERAKLTNALTKLQKKFIEL